MDNNQHSHFSISSLIAGHIRGALTANEQAGLDQWVAAKDEHARLFHELTDPALQQQQVRAMGRYEEEAALEQFLLKHRQSAIVHRVHFLRTAWFRYAAAVILLLGIGGYFLWSDRGEIPAKGGNDKGEVVKTPSVNNNNKPILTLASGKKIELDNNNAQTPLLVKEGAIFDPREAGQKPGVASYNTITTPKGSQYQVILSDGSKVWLNATSSIKFPTSFTAPTRTVEITGEAYMEITKNSQHPFQVKANGIDLKVLGTSFNISAYNDEIAKTTLVTGAIKVNDLLLSPGQAYVEGKIVKTDIGQDIAWKNGVFNFEGLDLKQVMNELKRWYDIEVVYQSGIPDITFFGEMGKDVDLTGILAFLEGAGVHFRMEGKKLIIMP